VLRNHGMHPTRKYWHEVIGYNYRMTNIQAALGVAQLHHARRWAEKKRHVNLRYRQLLGGFYPALSFPQERPGTTSSCWLSALVLRTPEDRDSLMAHLAQRNVETRPLFPPLHIMPPYLRWSHRPLPVTESFSSRSLLLPSSTKLADDDVAYICRLIADWLCSA